ncbi:hypothetical protein [Solidesulfovibrio alcoholivorans]|uniref:hypothetical protein n=1 Tax=Solidesulfovibrio alcoholivorans TaxID=81406 RepID=UPI00049667AB|nr:hypothetical protein [Solidesulfovibrio alcoholivorans]
MNRICLLLVVSLSLLWPGQATAADPVTVDVLFMDHGPLRPTLNKLKEVFEGYGTRLTVRWHDFESPEGEEFMAKMGITNHVPLVIWMNGKDSIAIDGTMCTFSGFPSGSGPAMFQGKWTIEQLSKALEMITK